MKLILFDLDQTLVDFMSVHDKSTFESFKECFGVDVHLTEIHFAGQSKVQNFIELAKLKNIPSDIFRQKRKLLLKRFEASFNKNILSCDTYNKCVLPGVIQLLGKLSEIGYLIVLYTGNSRETANQILKVTGLGKYFKFSVSGSINNRISTVKRAVRKAEILVGKNFTDIVVIGDSIKDVECGKIIGAKTIAVTTGFHSRKELQEYKPDFVFNNLENCNQILEAIKKSDENRIGHKWTR